MKKNKDMYDMMNTPMGTKHKKGKMGLVITIIIVLFVMLIVGFILMYTTTDLFKSNKEMFFKYASQIADEKESFIDENLIEYFNKKASMPYSNEGSYSANIQSDDEKDYEAVNNYSVTFSGQTDKTNSRAYQEVNLNYTDDVSIPTIKYRKVDNIVGLQTDCVSSKTIAFELDKLSDLLGIDFNIEELLEKTENTSSIQFTDEEIEHIQETYVKIIEDKITNDKFSKIDNGYKLTITGNDIIDVIKSLLETLKNDEMMINKINEISISEEQITSEDITNIIETLNRADSTNSTLNNINIQISVYTNKEKLNKIEIIANIEESSVNIALEKQSNSGNTNYKLEYETINGEETVNMTASANFTGLNSDNVGENYELGFSMGGTQMTYTLNNNITFDSSISIDDFVHQDTILLTQYGQEEVQSFLGQVGQRIEEVNNKLMQDAGISEGNNPVIDSIPIFGPIMKLTSNNQLLDNTADTIVEENTATE